jgi:hypothetical protein
MSELLESTTIALKREPSEELLRKLGKVVDDLETDTGGLALFGLFEPSGAPDRWDVVVAANWVDSEPADAIAYVAGKLQQHLSDEDLASLAGAVTLQASHPFVQQLLTGRTGIRPSGALVRLENLRCNDIHLDRAWIFTADPTRQGRFAPPPYVVQEQAGARTRAAKDRKPAARRRR